VKFHQKCDAKGPTVVVVRSTGGYLFGGYTSQSWDSSNSWKSDAKAFLFTLTNPYSSPNKFPISNAGNAIYCNATYGPAFGAGHDLVINTSNVTTSFPNSYRDTVGHGGNIFAGSANIQISDFEVFLVK